MRMKYNEQYELFGSNVFEWSFDNGFRAVLLQNRDTQRKLAMMTVPGGSYTESFLFAGERHHSQLGAAHFLEHVLFDSEDKKVHAKFAECNALSNAYTSYASTAYFFSTITDFKACLEILIQAVVEPSFHEDMIERERDVILQELAMYEDHPDYVADLQFMRMLGEGERFNILGTRESLKKMTENDLRSLHQSLYRPERMTLVMMGNVEPEFVLQVIEMDERLALQADSSFGSVTDCSSEIQTKTSTSTIELEIVQHICRMGWRIPSVAREGMERSRKLAATQILLEALFGRASEFQVRLSDEGRLLEPINVRTELLDDEIVVVLEATGSQLESLPEYVLQVISEVQEKGIAEGALIAAKNRLYGEWIIMYDDMPTFLYEFSDMMIRNVPLRQFLIALDEVWTVEVLEVLDEFKDDQFISAWVTGKGV